jgi:hypothetical protein
MNIKDKMTSIRQENPVLCVKAFRLKRRKLVEEGWDMDDASGADEIDCAGINET